MRQGKKRFPRTIDRNDLGFRVDAGEPVAAFYPASDRTPQGRYAQRGRIVRQPAEPGNQRFLDEGRSFVLRFADRELDFLVLRIGCDAGKELAQFFKRVGVQFGEMWIHGIHGG